MRIFRGSIFLGSGDHSMRAVDALHERIDDAVSHLGGLQQSHPGEEEQDAQDQIEIEEAVRDIASALLGREVAFRDVQPKSDDAEGVHAYLGAKNRQYTSRLSPKDCTCPNYVMRRQSWCPAQLSHTDLFRKEKWS